MYYKQCTGVILIRKSDGQLDWVKWVHRSEGRTHCPECLMLDGCYFTANNHPPCPHHPYCHCILEPIDYALVLANAVANSAYSKFVPYLFNTTGGYTHNKEKLFKKWGYSAADAKWLQAEMERQAREKYLSGEYKLGVLNKDGQRISIRVTILRKDNGKPVSFLTGWMLYPNGRIQLTTPYGGK